MIFTRTTTYAIRILILMASENKKVYSARYLFSALGIHNRYLRRVLTLLTNRGFLCSVRGKNGGFAFSKDPGRIFLSEIIDATGDLDSLSRCIMGIKDCRVADRCNMHDLWEETRQRMVSIFTGTSVGQLAGSTKLTIPITIKTK
jgi:Rrf2 family transcriptional regulator, nitric oxide-sensitive transcriptional repressor